MKNFFLLSLWFTWLTALPQGTPRSTESNLQSETYTYLDEKIEAAADLPAALPYLKAYLGKAQLEQNPEEIVNGYKNFLHASAEEQRLVYADSMVLAAKKADDNNLMGSAYLTKGIVYFSKKQHVKALDHYLLAKQYLDSGNDPYLKNKVKYNIANIKYYLGFYNDAIALYKDCQLYFKQDNPMAYISCMHSLGLCYNRMGNYAESGQINAFALRECKRLATPEMVPYIRLSQGINMYFLRHYKEAVIQISGVMDGLRKEGDFANESVAHFYLGKSVLAVNKKQDALTHFRKVDQLFKEKGYLRPDLRESYEVLIASSREQGNIRGELYYINRLLQADSLLASDYKSLSETMHKKYDTAELIKSKKAIEEQLSGKRYQER